MKHPFLKLFYPKKKKKTELERVLFLVFMLFLKQINLKKVLNPLFYPFFKSLIKIFFTIP
ncbi:hypothetical protein C2S49_01630 [Helicobacter pylori]|uniref:hypothetical protein n=1 Tax=Helicobacter pylori TaxID=210 RepID=UPI000D366231|nr:hypothetical protein [Helicobacter pylori]PUB95332.1 hypothetical protein C2S49_01630 [Helicobacter pylori]